MTVPQAHLRTGIALMLAGMLVFSLNDVLGKALMARYSAWQLMLIRSLSALVFLLPFLWQARARIFAVTRPRLHVLRAALLSVEGIGFYFALGYLPVADAVTYWLAAPVYVAALSPVLLNERVDWRGWLAVVTGFAGVLIALEPSAASFTLPALVALVGSIAFALAMILARKLSDAPDLTLVLWPIVGAILAGGAGALLVPGGWRAMPPVDLGLLCLLGVIAMAAHMMVNRSFKHGPAATLMPFQYTLLPWAVLFGAIFFGDVPRPAMLLGAALIVAAGLYIALRKPAPVTASAPRLQ